MSEPVRTEWLLVEHADWNSKHMFVDGEWLWRHDRLPKVVHFHSPMLNDENQSLCGGWYTSDGREEHERILAQLISGRKPFGTFHVCSDRKSDLESLSKQLSDAGLESEIRSRMMRSKVMWDLLSCQRAMCVCDIGDLDLLIADYDGVMDDAGQKIRQYANRRLSSFFGGWDSPPLPQWLTGLILGYPVENTVGAYLIRHAERQVS